MTATKTNYLSLYKFLVLILLFNVTKFSAQNNSNFSIEKVTYRVIAIKLDTNRIESVSNTVELVKPTTVYLPNAFSPDQDGSNDQFGAVGINAEKYELKIFNRWGELLFESKNIAYKWDGTHNGKRVPGGVYVYTLFAKEITTGRNISKTGTVTLLI